MANVELQYQFPYKVAAPSIIDDFPLWWHEARLRHDPHYRKRCEQIAEDQIRRRLDWDVFAKVMFGWN